MQATQMQLSKSHSTLFAPVKNSLSRQALLQENAHKLLLLTCQDLCSSGRAFEIGVCGIGSIAKLNAQDASVHHLSQQLFTVFFAHCFGCFSSTNYLSHRRVPGPKFSTQIDDTPNADTTVLIAPIYPSVVQICIHALSVTSTQPEHGNFVDHLQAIDIVCSTDCDFTCMSAL